MLETMYDVRLKNRQAGYHFFDPGALRFFRSRIGNELYGGRYFVTSEQFVGSNGYTAPRKYTIREVRPDGGIGTVAGFQEYNSSSAARAAIKRILQTVQAESAEAIGQDGMDA